MNPPELSVVIAVDGSAERIAECVAAVAHSCAGIATEVIVVHREGAPVRVSTPSEIPVTMVAVREDLVPVLWGRGIAIATGRFVALTTTQFRVAEAWARALLAPFASGDVAGVGGRMALPDDSSVMTRAVFLIRYSEHMGGGAAPGSAPRDIAGDNAAYRRDVVIRSCPDVARGFWEVDAHRLMRADGFRFVFAADAIAYFRPHMSLGVMLANRFVHGGHYGRYRVDVLRWPRWRAVLVTPLVPLVLGGRILARVRRTGQPLGFALPAVPFMIPLLAAWAAGEATGALQSRPSASSPSSRAGA